MIDMLRFEPRCRLRVVAASRTRSATATVRCAMPGAKPAICAAEEQAA